jgi:WD40 repeat protein
MATRKPRPFVAVDNTLYGLAYSPNGSLLASAHNGGGVRLWDRASGRMVTNIIAHPPFAFDVEFSRDGRFLASSGADGIGKIWEVTPGGLKLLHRLPGHLGWVSLSFSPDGRRVVSGGTSDTTLKLWDTKTGFEVGALYGHRGRFAFSRDGNAIYYADESGAVRVWRAPPLDELKPSVKEKEIKR